MRRILVLFAHPAQQRSKLNRLLRAEIEGVDGITVHDLYSAYPDSVLDVHAEQALAVEHDVLVFQHPFFWYSSPAIIKEWQDLVLQHGWAYGIDGTALHGKLWLSAITTGGNQDAYSHSGHNHYTIRELLRPFERTAELCGIEFLPPFVVHGSHALRAAEAIMPQARRYRALLEGLRDETVDLVGLRARDYANRDDDGGRDGR
jgi:glutathione-regulated potassium-efflux system ancillary protein KefG